MLYRLWAVCKLSCIIIDGALAWQRTPSRDPVAPKGVECWSVMTYDAFLDRWAR